MEEGSWKMEDGRWKFRRQNLEKKSKRILCHFDKGEITQIFKMPVDIPPVIDFISITIYANKNHSLSKASFI